MRIWCELEEYEKLVQMILIYLKGLDIIFSFYTNINGKQHRLKSYLGQHNSFISFVYEKLFKSNVNSSQY